MTASRLRRTDRDRTSAQDAGWGSWLLWVFLVAAAQLGQLPELSEGVTGMRFVAAVGFAPAGVWALAVRGGTLRISLGQLLLGLVFSATVLYITELGDFRESLFVTALTLWILLGAAFLSSASRTGGGLTREISAITFASEGFVIWILWLAVFMPEVAFVRGLGRLAPYGSGSVIIAPSIALASILAVSALYNTSSLGVRIWHATMLLVTVGAGMLTGSRSFLISVIVAGVVIVAKRGKYRHAVLLVAVGAMTYLTVGSVFDSSKSLERLSSVESGRYELVGSYLDLIADRPILGLMGVVGESYEKDSGIGYHTHNAYLHVARLGGLPMLLAWVGCLLVAFYGVARSWRRRELDVVVFAAVFVATVAHGFVNRTIITPVYPWAWLHFSSCLYFMYEASSERNRIDVTLATRSRQASRRLALTPPHS